MMIGRSGGASVMMIEKGGDPDFSASRGAPVQAADFTQNKAGLFYQEGGGALCAQGYFKLARPGESMKCGICKKEAAVSLKAHNFAFCEDCYLDYFRRQIKRGIKEKALFDHGDRILAAVSGGKDSLSMLLELSELGFNVTGLFVDLGIPGSSARAREIAGAFCSEHGIELKIVSLEREGLAIPVIKKLTRRPVCAVCGKIKRHFFNKAALEGNYDALATGHNLDDEAARLFSNVLRWDEGYLADQGPLLEPEADFVRKVKPLWRLTEYETANYAFIRGINHHLAPCPYSGGASFTKLKRVLQSLETAMPNSKLNFYQGFLDRGKKFFEGGGVSCGAPASKCSSCGFPTYGDDICGVCRLRRLAAEKGGENKSAP